MAKRRKMNEELLMVPFLDILCSLIGVLVLIIVVLTVAQTRQIQARTPEELEMSVEYMKTKKEIEEAQAKAPEVTRKNQDLQKLKENLQDQESRMAKLRMLLNPDSKESPETMNMNLVKELDNLLLELAGYDRQDDELQKEIAELEEELKQRKISIENQVSPVIVQPSGSGNGGAQGKVYFVEAAGGRLTIYWSMEEKTNLSSADEVVAADTAYNEFLKNVSADPSALIVFLVREDGMGSYNKGAGWGQMTYGLKVNQFARIPIPGRGPVDLHMFKDKFGVMTPPEGVTVEKVNAPANPPAAAPQPAPAG